MPFVFEITSDLKAPKQVVLAHATGMPGVNQELGPLLSMTSPRSFRGRSLFEAPVGEPLFRSWVLLGGVVPIDFDHLCFESIDPDSGFVETSTMLSMSTWRHERRVTERDDGGSHIVDRISFTPRVPGTGPLLARVAEALFRHRHAKLRAIFGAGMPAS
jgi:hypothetical protein